MKILIALIAALMISLPATAGAPLPRLWNCMQIGFLNEQPAMVVSDIQNGNKDPGKHYKTREKAFAVAVKKQWKLKGVYEPMCNDFADEKEADFYYKYIVQKANDQGITVYPMQFSWKVKK